MSTESLIARCLASYPVLGSLPPHQLAADLPTLPHLRLAARTTVFDEGQACQGFPFVLAGELTVLRRAPDGRELSLYRVSAGEVCVVSAGCLFGARSMNATGISLSDCEMLIASADLIETWTDHRPIRDFLFGTLADRLTDLMELVEAVAFQRLDRRLAKALLGHGQVLQITHQQIADELGTAREMVSRLLKRFEADGLVGLARERIEILNAAGLRSLAGDQ